MQNMPRLLIAIVFLLALGVGFSVRAASPAVRSPILDSELAQVSPSPVPMAVHCVRAGNPCGETGTSCSAGNHCATDFSSFMNDGFFAALLSERALWGSPPARASGLAPTPPLGPPRLIQTIVDS